jgi:hypothetical protein
MPKKKTLAAALAEIDQRAEDAELLDEQALETIKEKARKHVQDKRRKIVEEKVLAAAIDEEERRYDIQEQYEDVQIDLAPFVASERLNAACIVLDGTIYTHGQTYSVRYSVARTLEDVMARGWEHENEIHGRRRRQDTYRRPVLPHISQGQEGMPASALNKRSTVTRVTA